MSCVLDGTGYVIFNALMLAGEPKRLLYALQYATCVDNLGVEK